MDYQIREITPDAINHGAITDAAEKAQNDSDFSMSSLYDAADTLAAMDNVAIEHAHSMAAMLDLILCEYDGRFYDMAIDRLSKYREAMNAIHEAESPTHMGEPLIAGVKAK